MALLLDSAAPDFTLPGWDGSVPHTYTLSQREPGPMVLAFYPGDERVVCTRQLCSYSDRLAELHEYDATVWAISPDGVSAHRDFSAGNRLAMPLLSDPAHAVARSYGVLGPFGLRRSVFVLDRAGRVAWRWVATVNLTFPGLDEVRRALDRTGAALERSHAGATSPRWS
jgi:peroxiredoxin Q/BCP